MTIDSIALLAGAVFTGMSVLVAVVSFRRAEDRRAFSQFRLSLVELRQAIRELDGLLAEPFFNQVGLAIAAELRQLFVAQPLKGEIRAYILDKSHHPYIAQAIHAGLQQSPILARCSTIIDVIDRTPYQYQEQLPLVSLVLRSLSVYINRTAHMLLAPRLFDEVIGTPENFESLAADRFDTDKVSDAEAFREIGIMLVTAQHTLLTTQGQRIYDATESIIVEVVGTFSRMTDSELRKQSKVQRSQRSELEAVDYEYAIENAFEYLKRARSLFDETAWDRIVENKTIIMQNAHSNEEAG